MKHFAKWLMLAVVILSASCSTPAYYSYLRDMEYETPYLAKPAPELRLQVEDKVNIQVFSTVEDLAKPFTASVGAADGNGQSLAPSSSYTIDKNGNIDFPVLGSLHIEGKTLNEVKEEIAGEIVRLGYIREPLVKVEMENFNITVIGQMGQQILPVEGNSINILQVLARTSGANEYTNLQDVMVIRTEEGERVAHSINLQSKSLFDSPVYYLQQNDVVYVKPRGLRPSSTMTAIMSAFTPLITVGSTLSTLILLLTRL
ncbi:MAG: polysaccharide biosynthesis/export family protein [Bacteroidales bacterium]|nr:polysaccharide biosynthesis/export family protein [Bacteroidales bacterium]